ncbi:MAG: hypothetical protein GX567_06200 [Clostridia bacterium]|nr:hypothetical protein [Clostridia bacterium]
MKTKTRKDFISTRLWLQDVMTNDVILCGVSALEYLEMFSGFFDEAIIDVYSTRKGVYENINYNIVDSYDNIDYFISDNICCTTFEQTINDMLRDFENNDEMALTEALSNYYYSHNESFAGLNIMPENKDTFEQLKQPVIDYYRG